MASSTRYKGQDRDAGGFVALPFAVIDSTAFRGLSVHAKALLIDIARQARPGTNGMLLCSRAHMAPLGWKSNDMLFKSRDELITAGFLHQTVMGRRPSRASWYAVTWLNLDKIDGFDVGAAETFVRSAYRMQEPLRTKPTREELYRRWDGAAKTQSLPRPTGQEVTS